MDAWDFFWKSGRSSLNSFYLILQWQKNLKLYIGSNHVGEKEKSDHAETL